MNHSMSDTTCLSQPTHKIQQPSTAAVSRNINSRQLGLINFKWPLCYIEQPATIIGVMATHLTTETTWRPRGTPWG